MENYAPEDFKFSINQEVCLKDPIDQSMKSFIADLIVEIDNKENLFKTDKELHEKIYEIIHRHENCTPNDVFKSLYLILISKEKGPKLAGFIRTIGFSHTVNLLKQVL